MYKSWDSFGCFFGGFFFCVCGGGGGGLSLLIQTFSHHIKFFRKYEGYYDDNEIT